MARRANPRDLGSDSLHYDAEPEPNMRLSRAIAVVLILHIVAIGGVLAFSLIKDRAPQPASKSKPATAAPAAAPAPATAPGGSPAAAIVAATGLIPSSPTKRGEPAIQTDKSPAITPVSTTTGPATAPKPATKTIPYIVRQGDTLARVASEHGVSLGALIAVNEARVTTTNLKPGQEIQLPVIGAPKDRAQDEAARLIETSGGAKPLPVTAKALTPAATSAKPPTANPIPATLVAKPTNALPPPPAPELTHTKSTAPPPSMAKASTPTPSTTKPAKPEPKVEKAHPVKAPDAKPAAVAASWESHTYVVVAGDNPTKLAKKFGVTENALLKANGITDARKLQVGQRIVIPSRKPKH